MQLSAQVETRYPNMFDYKKEFKEFYRPKTKPEIITIPEMKFIAVKGKGNPNDAEGEYSKSISLLYGVAYTLKMSYKTDYEIEGFFQYVVPPLEGLWWIEGLKGMDYKRKADFSFISLIRIPDFISEEDVNWAIDQVSRKKKVDYSSVYFMTYDEGLVVQCMHIGPYDDEPRTVNEMTNFILDNGYEHDFSSRYHHEIYISDPRKANLENLKTVIRHPIRRSTN